MLFKPTPDVRIQIEIPLGAYAPEQMKRPVAGDVKSLLKNGFDRCKACAASHQDHRFCIVLSEEKRAERALKTHQFLDLESVEHVTGESTIRDLAHVKFKRGIGLGPIGNREAASFAIAQQNIDVLTGQVFKIFSFGQGKFEHHHIVRQCSECGHPAGQHANFKGNAAGDFAGINLKVAERFGLT